MAATWWQRHGPIFAIGVTQTIGFGTLIYAFSVQLPRMALDLGLSTSAIFGQLSLALFFSGLVAPVAGKAVDRFGGRIVLTIGSIAAFFATLGLALANSAPGVFLGILVIDIVAMFVLYDTAFAAIAQIRSGRSARQGIGMVTLMGGFASTIFWPLTLFLADGWGWQATWVALGAFNLLVCAPLHWVALRPAHGIDPAQPQTGSQDWPRLQGDARRRGMIWTTIALALAGFYFGALMVLWETNARDLGHSAVAAAAAGALIGPAKTAGRLLEMMFGRALHPIWTTAISLLIILLSFAVVLGFGASFVGLAIFAVLYGLGDGLRAIIRGTLPLALFGGKDYGARLGWIAIVRLSLNAGAPFLFATITEHFGATSSFALMAAVTVLALLAVFRIPRPQGVP